jgi:hypothetical protein
MASSLQNTSSLSSHWQNRLGYWLEFCFVPSRSVVPAESSGPSQEKVDLVFIPRHL